MKEMRSDALTYAQMRNTGRREEIQLIACVNGNTVRKTNYDHKCEIYDFTERSNRERQIHGRRQDASAVRTGSRSRNRHHGRHRKMQKRMRNAGYVLCGMIAALMITILAGIGSRASSRDIPKAYKYYDTITVGYQENLLDIVERYDDREFYETQKDYVKELCRINNPAYDDTGYPEVSPGTHLVVPYYSQELK